MKQAVSSYIEHSSDGYLVIREDRILDCNSASVALLGCKSIGDVKGKRVADFSTPEQPDGLPSAKAWEFYAEEAAQEGFSQFEWTYLEANQAESWLEIRISPVDKHPGEYLVTLRDINERKSKEHKTNLRAARMIIQNQILTELTRINDPDLDLEEYFQLFTRIVAQVPDIDRTSVWTLKSNNRTLIQKSVHPEEDPSQGVDRFRISRSKHPRFFTQLHRPIIAHTALTDNRTNELNAGYLDPNEIKSIIFTPIPLGEKLYGLLSLERVGKVGKWEIEEQSFAVAVSEIVTKQIEQRQRQVAEMKLLHTEKRQNSLIENARDAIAITDVDVNFFYASPAVEYFLGYTPEEFTKLNGAKLVHPKYRSVSQPAFEESLKTPGKAISTEFLFKHKNGSYIFLDITFYNLLHDETVKGVVMNFRDITERKRAEKNLLEVNDALKKSQSLLQQKVEEQEKTLRMFKKYVPEEVVQRAIEASEDSILEGEIRSVAVLFCDIRGFTPMSEHMTPKRVVSFLNEYYSVMTEIVKQNHGTVMQFVGDEVFATFGAPVNHPDNEVNAVLCSLEMMDQLEFLSSKADWPVEIGIGINSGEVVAGNLGSEDRIGYSVSGDTVNTGKRIESLTKDHTNSILISSAVYEKAKEFIEVKIWEPVQVKGKKERIFVYEVLGRNGKTTSMHTVTP